MKDVKQPESIIFNQKGNLNNNRYDLNNLVRTIVFDHVYTCRNKNIIGGIEIFNYDMYIIAHEKLLTPQHKICVFE